MKSERVRCPICRQGYVDSYRIMPTAERFQLCDDCECAWPDGGDVDSQPFTTFARLMEERRLPDHWDLVEIAREP